MAALDRLAERSEDFIVGFDEARLVQDTTHNCPITGRYLVDEIYWAVAEFARSCRDDLPSAVQLRHRCHINMIVLMQPWRRHQAAKGGRAAGKALPALCFSKNVQGIALAATLAQLCMGVDMIQVWFMAFGHLPITLALIPPGQLDKKKLYDSILATKVKLLRRVC